jgi:glycyl-tRNA synthetase beta chain
MSVRPLLLEIGCEEIPARMVSGAADDLKALLIRILDKAAIDHGPASAWGGPRRLAVRVEEVEAGQRDREEMVLGPPAAVAFDGDGALTKAARGFAGKQGIDPEQLVLVENEKGSYAGFRREVAGKTTGELLAQALPGGVAGISFPKSMRWGDGTMRWVRPVHWLLALHGDTVLDLELFGVKSSGCSEGHRFTSSEAVKVDHPDSYEPSLEAAGVVADPARRRERLVSVLNSAAEELGGRLVDDPPLLEEVIHLVEWPGDLELPRELLVTTLRHHQKCFSVQSADGTLLPAFLAVANSERDPGGHIRRGNEWVVNGRLDDARFFWREDRKRTLAELFEKLEKVVFHAKLGSYADKARRIRDLAGRLARRLGMGEAEAALCEKAALLSKNDLVTGTVGEFPELQGEVGGLLLREEAEPEELAGGVYSHYRPAGAHDSIPPTEVGCVVSVADKLDSAARLIEAGEMPTGSKDPFGLRRATSGIFRIVTQRRWPLALAALDELAGMDGAGRRFFLERLQNYLRESGSTVNEITAVLRPQVDPEEALGWNLHDIAARLEAIATVRTREDFALLADLTKRVDNILTKGRETFEKAEARAAGAEGFKEDKDAALELRKMIDRHSKEIEDEASGGRYLEVVEILARFVDPVERFFTDVLVLDPENPEATLHRKELLTRLSGVLTRCFDIRELAGQADRRGNRG